jgi:hypothetical protein
LSRGRRLRGSSVAAVATLMMVILTWPHRAKAVEAHVRSGEPDLRYTLQTLRGEAIDRCLGSCTLSAPPGEYWLWVAGPPGSTVRASRRRLVLHQDSLLRVSPAYDSTRSVGLFLGVAGPILIVGSLVLGQREGTTAIPLIGTGVGGVMTATGWYLFAVNSHPSIDAMPLARDRRAVVRLSGTF